MPKRLSRSELEVYWGLFFRSRVCRVKDCRGFFGLRGFVVGVFGGSGFVGVHKAGS